MIVKAIKHEDIYEEIYEKIEDLFNHEEIDSDNYEETYFDTLEIDSVIYQEIQNHYFGIDTLKHIIRANKMLK